MRYPSAKVNDYTVNRVRRLWVSQHLEKSRPRQVTFRRTNQRRNCGGVAQKELGRTGAVCLGANRPPDNASRPRYPPSASALLSLVRTLCLYTFSGTFQDEKIFIRHYIAMWSARSQQSRDGVKRADAGSARILQAASQPTREIENQ